MFWTEFIYFWELLEAFGKMAGDFEFEFKHYNWNYDTAYLYFQVATRNLTLVCSYVCLAKSRMRSKAVVVGRRYNFIPHLPKKGGITNLSTKTNCGRFDKVLFSWYIVCIYTLQNCFGEYVGGSFLTYKIFDAQNFNARIWLLRHMGWLLTQNAMLPVAMYFCLIERLIIWPNFDFTVIWNETTEKTLIHNSVSMLWYGFTFWWDLRTVQKSLKKGKNS